MNGKNEKYWQAYKNAHAKKTTKAKVKESEPKPEEIKEEKKKKQ